MKILEEQITLLIPAKYEKESLPVVLDSLKQYRFKKLVVLEKFDIETLKSIKKFNCKVTFQKKPGYGAALKHGINIASSKYICIFNADGSFRHKEISKMMSKFNKNNNLDFVFASRYYKNGSSDDDTFLTYIGNKFFSYCAKFFFKIKLNDILYTFVLGKKILFKNCNLKNDGFSICAELPLKVHYNKFLYLQVPSREKKRIAGTKKVNEFKDGLFILCYLIKYYIKNFLIKNS
jgi:glycosyltransferase involved in cell wall biosynthesis